LNAQARDGSQMLGVAQTACGVCERNLGSAASSADQAETVG
jgi:hypothetical protein